MDEVEIERTLEVVDDEIMNAFLDAQSQMILHSQVELNDEGIDTANSQNEFIIMDISQSNHANKEILTSEEVKPEEVELRSLLSQWNLNELIDACIAKRVFINILKIIKRHHIERLLKGFDLGTQILFENKLEEWRESIGIPMSPVYLDFQGTSSSSSSSNTSNTNTPSRFSPYQKSIPYQRSTPSPDNSCTIVLSDILNETSRGKGLVELYNKFSNFHEDQRSILISLIAQYYEEKGVKMSLAASYQLEQQILERFPSEKLNVKLYNKFYNLTTSFKVVSRPLGLSTEKKSSVNSEKFSRHLKHFEPENDAESCLKALKFDNLSSIEFDYTWKACSQFRLEYIKNNTTKDLMEKWPFYKQPSGYRLIDMDFETAFSQGDTLLEKWERSFNSIISFLSKENHIKDKNVKKLIDSLKTDIGISENGRDAALIWALHGYFVPTNKIIRIDPKTNKKVTTKFTIKDSQESVIFVGETQQVIEDHIEHIRKTKISVQPSLYCVGEDIFTIKDIFLHIEGVRYNFKSALKALDTCFKSMYLFDMQFPEESNMFYTFLECFFYNFKGTRSYSKVHILLEYLQKKSF
ncbi:hypothetical protein ACI65C_006814 [Semiaphis heraclei]